MRDGCFDVERERERNPVQRLKDWSLYNLIEFKGFCLVSFVKTFDLLFIYLAKVELILFFIDVILGSDIHTKKR